MKFIRFIKRDQGTYIYDRVGSTPSCSSRRHISRYARLRFSSTLIYANSRQSRYQWDAFNYKACSSSRNVERWVRVVTNSEEWSHFPKVQSFSLAYVYDISVNERVMWTFLSKAERMRWSTGYRTRFPSLIIPSFNKQIRRLAKSLLILTFIRIVTGSDLGRCTVYSQSRYTSVPIGERTDTILCYIIPLRLV
jgi:hypothetical protein